MNKFHDGFSDSSYEDLLNEYAGDSIPSKPMKNIEQAKPTGSSFSQAPRGENKNFYSQAKPLPKDEPDTFDIDLLDAFEVTNPIEPYDKKPVNKDVITPQSNDDYSPRRGKFMVNIDYAKNIANKVMTSARSKPRDEEVEIDYEGEDLAKRKSKKVSVDSIGELIVKSFRENSRSFIIFGCCILVSIVLAVVAISCVNDILAINRNGEKTIEVVLPNDADTSDAIKALDDAGLIKNKLFCNIFAKLMGYSDENYLPGIYYFTDDMGLEKMLTRFKTNTVKGAVISITIPEGYTVDQIFQRLEKNEICTASSLYKVLQTVDFGDEYDFIAKIDNPNERYCILEGYMFPATYEFEQGTEPANVIRKFLDAFENRWTEEFAAKATELGMTVDEVINLASIVEKEGDGKGQFLLISSVLHNRLNRSGIYPLLECNSTKDYVTNTIAKRVSASKLSEYVVNYNTYDKGCIGLPPSPICNPGLDAIEAALFPTPSQYYYFRHDKNRKIYMAETLEQHSANGRTIEKVNAED